MTQSGHTDLQGQRSNSTHPGQRGSAVERYLSALLLHGFFRRRVPDGGGWKQLLGIFFLNSYGLNAAMVRDRLFSKFSRFTNLFQAICC